LGPGAALSFPPSLGPWRGGRPAFSLPSVVQGAFGVFVSRQSGGRAQRSPVSEQR